MRYVRSAATAAAAMTLAMGTAATAAAAPAARHHRVSQVTGHTLAKALLPAWKYGHGYQAVQHSLMTTGRGWHQDWTMGSLTRERCRDYTIGFPMGHGQTAEANNTISDNNGFASWEIGQAEEATQDISQFRNGWQAVRFFKQDLSKARQCRRVSVKLAGSGGSGSTTITVTNISVRRVGIAHHWAFQLDQSVDISGMGGFPQFLETTVLVNGSDVYTVQELNSADDAVPPSLLAIMMQRTERLYW